MEMACFGTLQFMHKIMSLYRIRIGHHTVYSCITSYTHSVRVMLPYSQSTLPSSIGLCYVTVYHCYSIR